MALRCNKSPSAVDLELCALSLFDHVGQMFEVLADAGLLDMELRISSTSPRKITLGASQSNDATRI
jgi:hypothetical protein